MAVGANTYGTVVKVQAYVGDLAVSGNRTFAAGTVPTNTEVEAILDEFAAEINVTLEGARYTLETAADLATNQPRISDYLIALNSVGAAAAVLTTHPEATAVDDIDQPGGGRAGALRARYLRGLKMIQDGRLSATRSTIRVKVGSQADSETGRVKKPIFTRAITDFPSTRSLLEP